MKICLELDGWRKIVEKDIGGDCIAISIEPPMSYSVGDAHKACEMEVLKVTFCNSGSFTGNGVPLYKADI